MRLVVGTNVLVVIIVSASCVMLLTGLAANYPTAYDTVSKALTDSLGSALLKLQEHFWFYIPLGIVGLWRWSVWGIKKVCSMYYLPIEPTRPSQGTTLSIVTPVYNEEPSRFKAALDSWEANNPDELIAVIDEVDKACIEIFKEFKKNKPWARLVITAEPGKRSALADGILLSQSSIIALADSDTIWAPNIKQTLLVPFKDPKIAGVTPRNHVIECVSIWQKMTDIFWDMRNYIDMPSQTAMGECLSCLTGRTSLYRREVLVPKLHEFLNEYILGRRKESGEDKCLTRLVQQEGWKTYYQSDAVIYSYAPSDFRTFWKQRMRWTRNSHNSDLKSLLDGWVWKHHYLTFCMIDRFVSTFTLFLGPIYFGIAVVLQQWVVAGAILCLWIVGRGIKIIPHLRRRPEDTVLVPVFVAINFMIAIIKLYALITLREQKWIRRHYKLEGWEEKTSLRQRLKDIVLTGEIISCIAIFAISVLK
jgi:glycosyltransferase involved in cell wall biosynthesis